MVNRLAGLLAIATLVLAASTLYFARAVKLERTSPLRAQGIALRAAQGTSLPATPGTPPVTTSSDRAGAPTQQNGWEATYTKQLLAQLRDPAVHAARVGTRRMNLQNSSDMRDMATYMKLSPQELDRFIDLLAEREMLDRQQSLECQLAPGCDQLKALTARKEAQRQEIQQLLGPDKLRRFDTYMDSAEERSTVMEFNDSLPAELALNDTTALQLSIALAEERRQLEAIAVQSGEEVQSNSRGIFGVRGIDAPDGNLYSERTRQSAIAYNRRLQERAARILKPEQLAAFKRIQDETLANHEEDSRRWNAETAIRKAALDSRQTPQ